jgi:chromosome segregation ATPase
MLQLHTMLGMPPQRSDPTTESAAAESTTRDQQLAEAVQQLEGARSEIVSLKEDAASTNSLLEQSRAELADLIQQVGQHADCQSILLACMTGP